MELFERILSKEEINRRFVIAARAVLMNKLISSKTGLAESLGVKAAKFSEILNGRMNVGVDMIAKICDFHEISPEWLLLSRGNDVFRVQDKQTIWVDDDNLNMKYVKQDTSDIINPEKGVANSVTEKAHIPPMEESIIYKMYTDEREERIRIQKEKEELIRKIAVLEEQLRINEPSTPTARAASSEKSPSKTRTATSASARSGK